MIKIFLDQLRERNRDYIEDDFSAHEIKAIEKDAFVEVIKRYNDKRDIHSCYSEFVCHIGRFHREYGENWAGEEIAIFAKREIDKEYKRFYFNEKGQIKDWYYGFFD